jgi:putative endonuclease
MYEHKHGLLPGLTSKYRIHRLVHVEEFDHADQAIAREKQLKGWTRKRKIALIESVNPSLKDLSANWLSE